MDLFSANQTQATDVSEECECVGKFYSYIPFDHMHERQFLNIRYIFFLFFISILNQGRIIYV